MEFIAGLLVGLVVGACVGGMVMAWCAAAGRADGWMEEDR